MSSQSQPHVITMSIILFDSINNDIKEGFSETGDLGREGEGEREEEGEGTGGNRHWWMLYYMCDYQQ